MAAYPHSSTLSYLSQLTINLSRMDLEGAGVPVSLSPHFMQNSRTLKGFFYFSVLPLLHGMLEVQLIINCTFIILMQPVWSHNQFSTKHYYYFELYHKPHLLPSQIGRTSILLPPPPLQKNKKKLSQSSPSHYF